MLHTMQHNASQLYNKTIRMVPIAPAPEKNYTADLQAEVKRYNCRNNPYTGAQAASIARRNARERNRVKQVNDGFNALRKRLPASVVAALSGGSRRGSGKKLSKVDTLRMVVEYIKHMQKLIEESDASMGITSFKQTPAFDVDEGVFERNSPYSDSVPSPVSSECSSGVYSSGGNYQHYNVEEKQTSMDEDDLLEAISWWQDK